MVEVLGMTIHPTHTCFDDAADMLDQIILQDFSVARSEDILLVHGICHPPTFREYSHAWLEQDRRYALFTGIVDGERQEFKTCIEDFYKYFFVKETTKYTPMEALRENRRHVTYGPWLDKYKILCKDRT